MGFREDGSSHVTGIKNEEQLRKYLKSGAARKLYPHLSEGLDVIKRGGTTYKQDLEIIDNDTTILISAKKKETIDKGSFDWVNSSSAVRDVASTRAFAEVVRSVAESRPKYGRAKLTVQSAAYDAICSLTSQELTQLLDKHIKQKNEDMKIMITESKSGKNWEYSFSDSPLYHAIGSKTPEIVLGRGVDSAQIKFRDSNGNLIDYGLRVRVVTNNGIGALIGTSTANKRSDPVIKFQQDDIPSLISSLGNKVRMF